MYCATLFYSLERRILPDIECIFMSFNNCKCFLSNRKWIYFLICLTLIRFTLYIVEPCNIYYNENEYFMLHKTTFAPT